MAVSILITDSLIWMKFSPVQAILHSYKSEKCIKCYLFIKIKSENTDGMLLTTKFHLNHQSNCNSSATVNSLNVGDFSADPSFIFGIFIF